MSGSGGLGGRDFNGQIIKGSVIDLDRGIVNASVIIQSGGRTISMLMPVSEVAKAGLKKGGEVYCLISGKDVTVISDMKEYILRLHKNNPNMETYLVK